MSKSIATVCLRVPELQLQPDLLTLNTCVQPIAVCANICEQSLTCTVIMARGNFASCQALMTPVAITPVAEARIPSSHFPGEAGGIRL